MPYYRRRRPRRYARRAYAAPRRAFRRRGRSFRYRRSRRVTVRVPRPMPFGSKVIVALRFSQNFAISAGATGQQLFWNLNSVFDPDRTATLGTQPYGYKQYAALYNRYRVFRAKWSFTIPPATSNVLQITATPQNHDSTATSPSHAMEQPRSITRLVSQSPGQPARLSGSTYLPTISGRSSAQYRSDEYTQAHINANPVEIQTLRLFVATLTGASASTYGILNMVYFVEFFDPLNLAQS